MRFVCSLFAAVMLAATPATAQIAPETKNYSVEINFSDGIADILGRVDRVEQIMEERFRKYRHTQRSHREAGVFRFSKSLTEGTRWANETLIPEVENYTVTNLMTALTAANINRATPDFEGRIVYEIRRFKVENHDVAILNGTNSYMTGRVVALGADGEVIKAEKVTANLVVDPTVDREYTGPKYAFFQTDPANRVGPTLAYFVERALEKIWPDKKDEIHGPVIIRVSGPQEQVFQ